MTRTITPFAGRTAIIHEARLARRKELTGCRASRRVRSRMTMVVSRTLHVWAHIAREAVLHMGVARAPPRATVTLHDEGRNRLANTKNSHATRAMRMVARPRSIRISPARLYEPSERTGETPNRLIRPTYGTDRTELPGGNW